MIVAKRTTFEDGVWVERDIDAADFYATPTIPEHGMEGDAGREAALRARLTRQEQLAPQFGSGMISADGKSSFTMHDAGMRYINPDGPAAVTLIDFYASRADRAEAALREAREALRVIQDNAMNEGMGPIDFRYTTERRARRVLDAIAKL